MNVKTFVKNNLVQLICAAAGIVCALAAMLLAIGVTEKDGAVDVAVVVVTVVAICVSGVTFFFDFKGLGKILASGMYLCACVLFLSSQFGNIGYAAAGIHDIGNGIQPGFIVGMILYVAAVVAESIIVFWKTKQKGEEK